jgi:hypothetical protein
MHFAIVIIVYSVEGNNKQNIKFIYKPDKLINKILKITFVIQTGKQNMGGNLRICLEYSIIDRIG